MLNRLNRPLAAVAAIAAFGLAGALPGIALAKHGADDPVGHDAGHHHHHHHHHGGHGADDGPNHR